MHYHHGVRKTGVQKLALVSIVLLVLLIFAGAIVRVTGSGLGCPDWPTCWGKIIPPTSVEQIDVSILEERVERFKKSAARFGRDPDEITVAKLLNEYDPLQTWIEYLNRLLALPVLLANLILMIACLRTGKLPWLGVAAFSLVIISALTGIVVVASGLRAGVVTIHMALAFLQLFLLTYIFWAGGAKSANRPTISGPSRPRVLVLLVLVMIEWAMGSQIREVTDDLMREYGVDSRSRWIDEISQSWVYLVHRSFSWSILIAALWLGWQVNWQGSVPRAVLALVGSLMVMGLILSTSGIHAVVQVLHVGIAGVLVSLVYYWWLAAPSGKGGLRAN